MTDAPERIWAFNNKQIGYRFYASGPQPEFDNVEYVRADKVAELVEAAKAVLGNTNENGEGVVLIVHLLRLRAALAQWEAGE